ncbi:MAG: CbbQ/NirQ/NorQ/GpvN family protein [Pseudomonadota bacterium]|nr:MAG: CbbQ/NirQ/NorQ/GpvN family protein [Pseudomonadota bacterium]
MSTPAIETSQNVPLYLPQSNEREVFSSAYRRRLPLLIKGPTGCGKTRFVRHMAATLGRPLYTVACHDELSAADLVGRFLIRGEETVWQDGPLTHAVRDGGICYLDEVVEARKDTTVILHPLTDDRRELPLEKTGELIRAPAEFMLVVSYNPGYQHIFKNLKPSTRQRFVALTFDFPQAQLETEIITRETGLDEARAAHLVSLAHRLRALEGHDLEEVASTRLLVHAASLMMDALSPREACRVALVEALSDDPVVQEGLWETVQASFEA